MLLLYLARIADLGRGDLIKVDCAACHHVALLTPTALLKLGLSPSIKVLDLKWRVSCRGRGRGARGELSARSSGGARADDPGNLWHERARCGPLV
jgi:hypothetical protein